MKKAYFKWGALSARQRKVLCWWHKNSPYADYNGIIADGAIRSGKTVSMAFSFVIWAMSSYDRHNFGMCGKTIASLRRNVLGTLKNQLRARGYSANERRGDNLLVVAKGNVANSFYIFGGKDESSQDLIQGITLAGVLFDEVALMPRSFVEQATARCSVEGSKFWFNCNPGSVTHWFYQEWVLKSKRRKILYLHFTMEDNPALSEAVRLRYREIFHGTFYRRFVLGEWAAAEGLVYDFYESLAWPEAPAGPFEKWYISCDYGTVNPTSMGLWGRKNGAWYRVEEYYYDSRARGRQKTDGEYAADLKKLAGGRAIAAVVVDPSAASFIEVLRREGWRVVRAQNEVVSGIRLTAELLRTGRLVVCKGCEAARREFALYRWEECNGRDKVVKENDHAMDEIRYFAATVAARGETHGGVFAGTVKRRTF